MSSVADPSPAPSLSSSPWAGNAFRDVLKKRLREIPESPGVYRWLDAKGAILYVGKAKNLRRRMSTYLGAAAAKEGFRKRGLFQKMADLTVTVTNTELEALVLETHLIRTLKPRYNISLTKDTHYAFVKVTTADDFPSVHVVHQRVGDGALYFGPYSNPSSQRRMVEILRDLYRFRTCSMSLSVNRQPSLFPQGAKHRVPLDLVVRKRDRRLPCLDYHLRTCDGPCTATVDPASYRAQCTDPVVSFLRGDREVVLKGMIARLKEAPLRRKFERAEDLSFLLGYVGRSRRHALFALPGGKDADAVGFKTFRSTLHVVILQVRGGNLVNELSVRVRSPTDGADALSQFLARYYEDVSDVPDVVLLPCAIADAQPLWEWLGARKGKAVEVFSPAGGVERDLVDLAVRNARQKFDLLKTKRKAERLSSDIVKI